MAAAWPSTTSAGLPRIHTDEQPAIALNTALFYSKVFYFCHGVERVVLQPFVPPHVEYNHLSIAKANADRTPSTWNQNQLAHAERTANNNPTSATAQNTFYTALLRANMPKLVIERYETGRYASNAAADSVYLKALQITGSAPGGTSSFTQQPSSGLASDKLQAVGQAIAAQVKGGQMVRPGHTTGTGAKEAPLYVVVEESWGSTILKWVKTLLWVGLAGYVALVILTMVVEMTGNFRTKAGQNNEVQAQHQTVRFSDVHGCDEAKDELQELVEFLINPERFNQLGGKLPKGVLLTGPPGTGKTMLARAVAGEAGCPVFYMSGSEFDELYVGVGAKRVRDLFAQARNKAPSIIFIDELDAVGGKRNARDPAYAKQTLNQLLTELDGFSPSTGVILIAATNYPEALDKALTRPGRFDRRVTVPLPDVRGRIEILKHHMKNVPITGDVDATNLARATSGMSGADLANLVNQAAVHASRFKHKKVSSMDFEWAKDKIMMGAEVKSRLVREKDKVMTAYHEAGHCLANLFTPGTDQLYKMTIIPRGQALGVTHQLPPMDEVSRGYDQYLANIDVAMGGRAAEELIYGPNKVTSGITSDLSQATSIAYHLVARCGFSKALGNVDYTQDYEKLSSETKQQIEREVRQIVEDARERADKLMREKRKELEALKDALMEWETLDKAQIEKVLRGEKLEKLEVELRKDDDNDNSSSGPRGNNPQIKKPQQTSTPGGIGIKLPDVLLPPGTGTRGSEPEATG
ncbi:i-AAA protease yme1 [Exophiala xenobiotica]|uniref:I-AAA protease yme1 n=1 Tax=Lithohypha guttulata TaxID=1690604 RepID=A0ABR0K5V4_9EURO|nr:i-AAA protease yme1 [Lithohypha guttulata]KAK5324321.1 i-AAA protease yme1 [Exophiala xenobiotica]